MVDPTGHGFLEESHRGLNGEKYGMASYRKGFQGDSICDVLRATESEIKIKHNRQYSHIPLKKIRGRSQIDERGRRSDTAPWADVITTADIRKMHKKVESVSFMDYLPNSVKRRSNSPPSHL